MKTYLEEQTNRHPVWECCDLIKRCYQGARGAEHLLADLPRAKGYFLAEWEATPALDLPLYEEISPAVSRVNLGAWKYHGRSPEALFDLFAASATVAQEGEDLLEAYLAAAGEAFDKCARVLGLPYPGGAAMDKLTSVGNSDAFPFHEGSVDGAPYDFSFSGLKTSVINMVHTEQQRGRVMDDAFRADIAASFTKAVVKTVTGRLEMLLQNSDPNLNVVLSGGVAANSHLRKAVGELAEKYGRKLYLPPLKLCGDNAAMIAAQGYYEYMAGVRGELSLNAYATKRV